MVKIIPLTPSTASGLPRVYRTTVPVGQVIGRADGTNGDVRDIQLVQFFLRVFFKKHTDIMPRLPGKAGFLIDGKVGNQTIQGIHRFQAKFGQQGKVLMDDSRVSVAKGVFVPNTKLFWTIDALNAFAFTSLGATEFNNLFKNKEINAEAKQLADNLTEQELLLP